MLLEFIWSLWKRHDVERELDIEHFWIEFEIVMDVFEGFLFYAHPSIGGFQHLLMSAYYRLKRVSPYDGRPTTRTKTLYVRERTI